MRFNHHSPYHWLLVAVVAVIALFTFGHARGQSTNASAAFEERRHYPAGAAQFDEKLLGERHAVASNQSCRSGAAKHGRRAIVTRTRLLVQRLHAAPERRCRDQADQQRGELHRMPPPMAQEHCENPQAAPHVISPALRLT